MTPMIQKRNRQWRRRRTGKSGRRSVPSSSAATQVVVVVATCCCLFFFSFSAMTEASSAAGTETLVGIVGKDFVLLGADSSVSQSIALTASNLDKIAPLVDPFPEVPADDSDDKTTSPFISTSTRRIKRQQQRRQQTIVAAAAGDAADSDRLLSYLKAIGTLEEYKNGGLGCDVRWVSGGSTTSTTRNSAQLLNNHGGLDVRSMAHLARRCIWERLRSRTPYRVCLLIAGMMSVADATDDDVDVDKEYGNINIDDHDGGNVGDGDGTDVTSISISDEPFTSQKVQKQVRHAWSKVNNAATATAIIEGKSSEKLDRITSSSTGSSLYRPRLYWLDEYGSLQKIEYGAHGHGANFLLSILDQNYRPDLTRAEAVRLMNECFRELRSRYVVNSPEAPCIKCIDTQGVRWVNAATVGLLDGEDINGDGGKHKHKHE